MLSTPSMFHYSAITGRPSFTWPEGRRLAVYFALCLEHFPYGSGLGLAYSPGLSHPNSYNWGWREYGNRVGGWRLLELFDEYRLPLTILLNTACYDHCPDLVAAARARGAEIVAHGRTNGEHQNGMAVEAERALIAGDGSHQPPRGQTAERLDGPAHIPAADGNPARRGGIRLHAGLADRRSAGVDADSEWAVAQRALSARGERRADGRAPRRYRVPFADMAIDNFDEMFVQSARQSLVCGITIHSSSSANRSGCGSSVACWSISRRAGN